MPSTKQFDVDEALERAMDTFWEKGYEATSMTTLLDRMGIQKGSFYATFKSKHDVYLKGIERYVRERFVSFRKALEGESPKAAIEKMFDIVAQECRRKDRFRGCMVVNAALELAPTDEAVGRIVRDSLKKHEDLVASLIQAGQEKGEIPPHLDHRAVSKGLMGVLLAMRVNARAGMPSANLTALKSQAMLWLS